MTDIADISIPAKAFALAETLEAAPGVRVEAAKCATHGIEWVLPTVWVSGDDDQLEAFDAVIREDPTVERIVTTESFEATRCYTLEWNEAVLEVIDSMIANRGTVVSAETHGERWRLRIRFATHEQVEAFRSYFEATPYSFTVRELFTPKGGQKERSQLTPGQREVLTAAAKSGYYCVPRETTCKALAEEFDVSHQAVSEKLRRGTESLIKSTLSFEE